MHAKLRILFGCSTQSTFQRGVGSHRRSDSISRWLLSPPSSLLRSHLPSPDVLLSSGPIYFFLLTAISCTLAMCNMATQDLRTLCFSTSVPWCTQAIFGKPRRGNGVQNPRRLVMPVVNQPRDHSQLTAFLLLH